MEYKYIGPCRCGFGPRAFYMDEKGNIFHASQITTKNVLPEKTESKEQKVESEVGTVENKSMGLEKIVVGTGVGPCGNGIPRGGGRGFCGGWRRRYV